MKSNNITNITITALRWLLLPASLLYGLATQIRNLLYDKGLLKSYSPPCRTICVGNLAIGGTGKSPLTMWLVSTLKQQQKVAVLSRGYGRKTRGFMLVQTTSASHECGDEPLMIKRRHPDVIVAVCEDRVQGAKQLLKLYPGLQTLILDDAMQHRAILCSLNLLTTQYGSLYTNDIMLPTGNLREPASGAKRADLVIVTKCPEIAVLGSEAATQMRQQVRSQLKTDKFILSAIQYGTPTDADGNHVTLHKNIILLAAIANPIPMLKHLKKNNYEVETMFFADHHQFSEKDLLHLHDRLNARPADTTLLTTEKDLQRLRHLKAFSLIRPYLAIMPIEPIFDQENKLAKLINPACYHS